MVQCAVRHIGPQTRNYEANRWGDFWGGSSWHGNMDPSTIFNYEILHPLQEFLTVNDHNLEGIQIREGSNPKMEIWIPGVKYCHQILQMRWIRIYASKFQSQGP